MKKIITICLIATTIVACNNQAKHDAEILQAKQIAIDSVAKAETIKKAVVDSMKQVAVETKKQEKVVEKRTVSCFLVSTATCFIESTTAFLIVSAFATESIAICLA